LPRRSSVPAGQAPYTFSATEEPAGLTIGSDGTTGGQPARAGTYTFVAHMVDGSGAAASVKVRLVVRPHVAIGTARLRSAAAGGRYRARLAVRGGVALGAVSQKTLTLTIR